MDSSKSNFSIIDFNVIDLEKPLYELNYYKISNE